MKNYLFLSIISLFILSACNKEEPNQLEILFSIAPSDANYTIKSNVRNSFSVEEAKDFQSTLLFGNPIELSTSALDTSLISTQISSSSYEISGLSIQLNTAIINQENEEIINTANSFNYESTDFKIDVHAEEGYKGKVLFELDLEKSLSLDNDGNVIFEPFFEIKELL